MIMKLIIAVIMDPKDSLDSNVILAFLGSVSDKLKVKCDWSNEVFDTVKTTWRNKPGPFKGGPEAFMAKSFDLSDKSLAPYIRLVVADMANLSMEAESFQHAVNTSLLDVSFKFFNDADSIVAVIASELAELHLNDKGMSKFDAFYAAKRKEIN